jgi:excisionase family DNA binding protein
MKLTVPEAARRTGRNPETIRRWIWNGRLPSEKVGNQHLVDSEALDALSGLTEADDEAVRDVAGAWGDWLRETAAFRDRLRSGGRRVPAASELLRESRRGR